MADETKQKRSRTGDHLRAQGFDLTRKERGSDYYHVRCSQCEALVINGVACHETGCPNETIRRRH